MVGGVAGDNTGVVHPGGDRELGGDLQRGVMG